MLHWHKVTSLGRHSPLTCLLPSHTLCPLDWVWVRWISGSDGGGERSPCAPTSCQCNVWGRSVPGPTWPADRAVSPAEPRHPHWLENQVAWGQTGTYAFCVWLWRITKMWCVGNLITTVPMSMIPAFINQSFNAIKLFNRHWRQPSMYCMWLFFFF